MTDLQQSIFLNISRMSKYHSRSRFLSEPYLHFNRNRQEQIENQFQLVDFQGKGSITKEEFMDHLKSNHKDIDLELLGNVLKGMRWDYKGAVNKQDFCRLYAARESQLFREANQLISLRARMETIRGIFQQTKQFNPKFYAMVNIFKLYVRSDRPDTTYEDFFSLEIEYEDHSNKLDYLIQQPVYAAAEPSFELMLPVQQNYFFVKYKFIDPRSKNKESLGQCYLNFPLEKIYQGSGDNIQKSHIVRCDVTKNNQIRGYCEFNLNFQQDVPLRDIQMDQVERKISQQETYAASSPELAEYKHKEYEYLQYLWGIRHKTPHKIEQQDVKWMIVARLVLACVLGVLAVVVFSLGRCEPLCFLLMMLLLKNWKYIILRNQKFLMTWLTITAMLLDFIWISFASNKPSLINFLNLPAVIIFTYILIVVKGVLLFYLLLIEKAFSSDSEKQVKK